MGWPAKLPRTVLLLAALVLAAGAFYFSFGLHPIWWLVWLAPLPILMLAPELLGWQAFCLAFTARAVAGLNLWSYMHHVIQIPFPLVVGAVLIPASYFSAAVLLYREMINKRLKWIATLSFPIIMVAAEFLLSLLQGTFGNTGYTQLGNLPIAQLAALTGLWGIGFVVYLFPAAIASIVSPPQKLLLEAAVLGAFYVGVYSYGVVRLYTAPEASHSVLVGLVETHTGQDIFPQNQSTTMALMKEYATQVKPLAVHGAQFVVLPEMTALLFDPVSAQVDTLFQETARDSGVQILLGVIHVTNNHGYNEARLYSSSGQIEAVYRKHHLVPSLESRTTPGTDISVLSQPAGKVGIAICRDMDYPELARRYAQTQVGLVLVPAWDQGIDSVWHGHMALMRGVEDGFTIVRNAKVGLLTASDDRGRILAEKSTRPDGSLITMLVSVPVRHDSTLYQDWGDWFAWVDLAACGVMLISGVARKKNKTGLKSSDIDFGPAVTTV